MLSDYIKEIRESRGLSQRELGRIAGLSGAFISKLESGESKKPSVESLKNIARALKVPFSQLYSKYSDESTQVSMIKPRTPDEVLKEYTASLSASLPACIPVYNSLSDKQPATYSYVPKALVSGGIKMQGIISTINLGNIHQGDTLLVSKQIKPVAGDICVYEKDGQIVIEPFSKKINTEDCYVVVQSIHKFRESWQ